MRLQEIITYFQGVKRNGKTYMAYCPCHEAPGDGKHNQSLSISEGRDENVVMKCFAGCKTEHILTCVGLSMKDLFGKEKIKVHEGESILVGKYHYQDETGKVVYWIEKTLDSTGQKSFRPRRNDPDNQGKLLYNLEGVKRVLYNLPAVLKAVKEEQAIYICEGEKDCDAVNNLGLTATTNTFGAQAAWEDYYADWLKGSEIVIIEDKDEAGKKHTGKIKACLSGKVKSIKSLQLPDRGENKVKDAFDWINYGGTADELKELVLKTKEKSQSKEKLDIDLVVSDLKVSDFLYVPNHGLMRYENGFYQDYAQEYLEQSVKKIVPSLNRRLLGEIVKMFELTALIPKGKELNREFDFLNLRNGILNLKTMAMEDHRKDLYSSIQLPVSFKPTAKCERWELFMRECLEDDSLIKICQEFMGLCLIPETKFEKCLLLRGEGSNGKSTFIKILQYILGRQNFSTILMSSLDSGYNRAALENKLVNICGELEIKEIESSAYFKAIVSGDYIDAEYKYQNPFSFKPFCRMIFSCNELPRIKDRSMGFFRRWFIIPFNKTFSGDKADRNLEAKLIAEIDGIFIWAIIGLNRLLINNCFTHSDICVAEIDRFKKECNPVLEFVDSHCIIGNDQQIAKNDLYDHYKKFCANNGVHFLNNVNFWKEINKRAPNIYEKKERCEYYKRERIMIGISYDENK